jgi:hypothetical protein
VITPLVLAGDLDGREEDQQDDDEYGDDRDSGSCH